MTDSNDAYAENLARVNEVQTVFASEDICNAQGQIIAKQGMRIDNEMVDRITRFKLLRPLENSIVIENELDTTTLKECLEAYLTSDSSTEFLFNKYYNAEELSFLCGFACEHAIIRQKITVLSLLMPQVFEQAMFCAWLGYLISKKVDDSSVSKCTEIFMASMCHDLGMIHISVDILNHVHPVVTYNILKQVPKIPKTVVRAVMEHHENIDGTGYPRSRPGANLCAEGQLINLLDSVHAIYNRRFKPFSKPLSEIIPIIQISRHSRFGPLAKKLIVLLREIPSRNQCDLPEEHFPDIIQTVIGYGQYINYCMDVAKGTTTAVGFRHENEKLASIQNAIIHISMSVVQSGVANEGYMRWLGQAESEHLHHAYKELEEALLMMQEIIYQINNLKKLMGLYLDTDQTSEASVVLQEKLLQLNVQSTPKLSQALNELWLFA